MKMSENMATGMLHKVVQYSLVQKMRELVTDRHLNYPQTKLLIDNSKLKIKKEKCSSVENER